MIPLHRPGTSPVHRAPAGVKIALLALVAIGISVAPWPVWAVSAGAVVAVAAYAVAGLGLRGLVEQVLAARWVVVLLLVTQLVFLPLETALVGTGRVLVVLLLAALVTLTTPVARMLDAVERALGPFRRFGVDPLRVGLVLALAIGVVPVLQGFVAQLGEARRARGVRVPVFRLVVPLLVLALKHADELGDAMVARGLGDDEAEDADGDVGTAGSAVADGGRPEARRAHRRPSEDVA